MLPGCTQILCGSLGQEGSGNYCLLQKLQEEGYALLLKPVLAFTVAANGLKRDQDTYRDTLFCTLTKYQKIKNAFQEDLCSLCLNIFHNTIFTSFFVVCGAKLYFLLKFLVLI